MAKVIIWVGAFILSGCVGYSVGNPFLALPIGLVIGMIAVMITSQLDNRRY